jgi:hypothetical protein
LRKGKGKKKAENCLAVINVKSELPDDEDCGFLMCPLLKNRDRGMRSNLIDAIGFLAVMEGQALPCPIRPPRSANPRRLCLTLFRVFFCFVRVSGLCCRLAMVKRSDESRLLPSRW